MAVLTITYEPVRTIADTVPHPHRTLAGELLRWSAYAFRPDWKYTPEQCRILARWYELRDDAVPEDPNDPETWGRAFRWESGTLRRLKGWGKDPKMASVCAMEFVGPCRLVGFRADGSPIGGPPQEAWVQIFATAAGQNVNTMSAFSTIFSQAAIDRYQIKLGQEVCYAIQADTDGRQCRLEAKASSFRAAEGGRPSFSLLNETWHWVQATGGPRLAATIRPNSTKVGGRTMEITNAPVIGEESVAEGTWYAFQKQRDGINRDAGIYYDSVEAPPGVDLADEDQLRAAILCARGDSVWINPGRVMKDIWSASTTEDESRRKYLNQLSSHDDALVDRDTWDLATVEAADGIRPGERIVLAFDGGKTDDSTGLLAMRVRDKMVQKLALWEKPDGPAGKGWEVDGTEVNDMVAHVFKRYTVVGFFADVAGWESYVADWSEKYGKHLLIKASGKSTVGFDMRANQREITTEHMAMVGAIETVALPHVRDYSLTRHALNARKRPNQYGIGFGKESRESKLKVDLYACMVIAWIAHRRLTESGKLKPQKAPGQLQTRGGF
ncbi:terminase [Kitasatospora sp. NPDC097605]|uniref:terminase n=1 Tax=Kitasatospora sp. NPDC097605 TaxID=3157226 RepID=UPI0033313C38